MNCPQCGQPFDIVPPEELMVKRTEYWPAIVGADGPVKVTPWIVERPAPTKCSRCDYAPSGIEDGVSFTQ